MTVAQPSLSAKERQVRLRLRDDFPHYAEKVLRIRTKAGAIEPLRLNRAQQYIHERLEEQRQRTGRVRALILKGRQMGCSTYVEARYYWRVTHRSGVRAFILTHEAESTAALFEMAQRYHELCHPLVKPSTGASSAKELVFDRLDSAYKVGTAGNKGVGRGTTIQYMHASEVAFWPHASEHAKGILQAVPDEEGTEVILESTANGVGDYFHEQWQLAEAGETDYLAIFTPWFWQPEYRADVPNDFEADETEHRLAEIYGLDAAQLAWRRRKIRELSVGGMDGEAAFRQEYPMTAQEAFAVSGTDSLIEPESVAQGPRAQDAGQRSTHRGRGSGPLWRRQHRHHPSAGPCCLQAGDLPEALHDGDRRHRALDHPAGEAGPGADRCRRARGRCRRSSAGAGA
jgi:hypothetical protein